MRRSILLLVFIGLSGCQVVDRVGKTTEHMFGYFTGDTPGVYARKMEDQQFADERRTGIAWLSDHDYGLREPYTARYRQIATLDTDYTVRAMAIRALNRARDKESTPLFIKALGDANDLVRLEAAKALANVPDPTALAPLLKSVNDANENRDVRIAAADALKHFKNLQVARTLVSVLQGREFGVAWQARQSLVALTGQDLYYDEGAWLEYLTGPQKPFG